MLQAQVTSQNQSTAQIDVFLDDKNIGCLVVPLAQVDLLLACLSAPNRGLCPAQFCDELSAYRDNGTLPNLFLHAMLMGSFQRLFAQQELDPSNMAFLPHVLAWCDMCMPADIWGSASRVGEHLLWIASEKDDSQ